jgi:hypothetical protein
METLPWELIGQIGANLLPKWRCRLYLCRKEWILGHFLAERDLFRWHDINRGVLDEIDEIDYDVLEICEFTVISKRVYDGDTTFCRWQIDGEDDENEEFSYSYTEIVNINVTYEWACMKMNSEEEYVIYYDDDAYNSLSALYNRYTMDPYMYDLYCCIENIHGYLSDKELNRLLIACGKDIYLNIEDDPDCDDSLIDRIMVIRNRYGY